MKLHIYIEVNSLGTAVGLSDAYTVQPPRSGGQGRSTSKRSKRDPRAKEEFWLSKFYLFHTTHRLPGL